VLREEIGPDRRNLSSFGVYLWRFRARREVLERAIEEAGASGGLFRSPLQHHELTRNRF
jgi:hypothetical protein